MKEDNSQLTKKNEDFIFRFKKILAQDSKLTAEQLEDITEDVSTQLREAQGTGVTATQIFGTPTQAAQKYLDPKVTAKKLHDYKFWVLSLDTSLVIFMLFSAVFGFSLFFAKQQTNQGAGIVSLLLISILGGSIYTNIVLKLTPNPKLSQDPSSTKRWLYLAGAVIAWLVGFLVLGMLPTVINPTLPSIAYIILAIVAYGVFKWNRKQAGLKGGFFAISQLSQQARLDATKNKK